MCATREMCPLTHRCWELRNLLLRGTCAGLACLTSLRLMARRTQRLGDHSGAPNGVLDLHVSPGMASPATMPLSREEAPCARVSFKVRGGAGIDCRLRHG